METDVTNIDAEEVRNHLSKEMFIIEDTPDRYFKEWKTTDCISLAFSNIEDIIQNYESNKSIVLNHLNELDDIKTEVLNKMNGVISLLSKSLSNMTVRDVVSGVANIVGVGTQVSSLINGTNNESKENQRPAMTKKDNIDELMKDRAAGSEYERTQRQLDAEFENAFDLGTDENAVAKFFYNEEVHDISSRTEAEQIAAQQNNQAQQRSVEQQTIRNNKIHDISSRTEAEQMASQQNNQTQQRSVEQVESETIVATIHTNSGQNMNFRTDPGMNSGVIRSIPQGAPVEVTGESVMGADGIEWTPVKYGDQKGWVATDKIDIDTPYTPSSPIKGATVSQTTPNITSGVTANINTSSGQNLNFRTDPGMSSGIIKSIAPGESVNVTNQVEVKDGISWTKVKYGEQEGWVATNNIKINGDNL